MAIRKASDSTLTGKKYNDASAGATKIADIPDTPIIGTATALTDSSCSVSFTPVNTGGTVTNYTVVSTPGDIATTGSSSPITAVLLNASTTYTFKVRANNASGSSPLSESSNPATTEAAAPFTVDYLVVGGGGSSSGGSSGGGGAGGMRSTVTGTGGSGALESPITASALTNYLVTVGAGGGNSSTFSTITSLGGGNGGNESNGGSGGSGGGGSCRYAGSGAFDNMSGGAGTAGQGFAGGPGNCTSCYNGGGGGGAAGVGPGGSGACATGTAGGAGRASSITGSSVTYARGGGGSGGTGAAPANLGYGASNSGAGGSGVVILRYPVARTIVPAAGHTSSTTTDGSFKVTTFTAGTGNIQWA